MSRLVFHPLPVQPSGACVRIDTASGSNSPASGLLSVEGSPILSTLASDGVSGAVPAFLGPDGTTTLYVKTLNSAGAVTATATLAGTSSGSAPPSSTDLVAALVNGAPGSLDTLGEVATALAALPGAYPSKKAGDSETIAAAWTFTTPPAGVGAQSVYSPSASPPSNPVVGQTWFVSDAVPGSATLAVPVSGNSGITGTSAASAVFKVRGASGQSVPVFEINRASDGARQAAWADDGSLALGTSSAPTVKFSVNSTVTANSGTTNFGESHVLTGKATAGGSGQFAAVSVTGNYAPSSNVETTGYMVGVSSIATMTGARSKVVAGVDAYAKSTLTDTSTGTGTYSLYGVRASAENNGAGYVTHIMGIKVLTQTNLGVIDYAWGIYIADQATPTGGGTVNQTTAAMHIEQSGEGNAIAWGTGGATPNGGKLYVVAGALVFKGGSGTVTTLAPA